MLDLAIPCPNIITPSTNLRRATEQAPPTPATRFMRERRPPCACWQIKLKNRLQIRPCACLEVPPVALVGRVRTAPRRLWSNPATDVVVRTARHPCVCLSPPPPLSQICVAGCARCRRASFLAPPSQMAMHALTAERPPMCSSPAILSDGVGAAAPRVFAPSADHFAARGERTLPPHPIMLNCSQSSSPSCCEDMQSVQTILEWMTR